MDIDGLYVNFGGCIILHWEESKVKFRYVLDNDKQIKVYRGDMYLGKYKSFDEIFTLIMAIA